MRLRRAGFFAIVTTSLLGPLTAGCPTPSASSPVPCELTLRLTGDLQVDVHHGVEQGCGPLPRGWSEHAAEAGASSDASSVAAPDSSTDDADGPDAGGEGGTDGGGIDGSGPEAGRSTPAITADAGATVEGAPDAGSGPLVTFEWGSAYTASLVVALEMPMPARGKWSRDQPATLRIVDGPRSWQTPPGQCTVEVVKSSPSASRRRKLDSGTEVDEYDIEGKGTCYAADGGGVTALPARGEAKKELIVGDFVFRIWNVYP